MSSTNFTWSILEYLDPNDLALYSPKAFKDSETSVLHFEGNGAIYQIGNNLENNKKPENTKAHANITSAIVPMVYSCTDSMAMLGHVNAELEQNR